MDKIVEIQKVLFPDSPMEQDGKWGPKSQAALDALKVTTSPQPIISSTPAPWPKEYEAALFYGKSNGTSEWEEANLVTFEPPYTLYMDGYLITRVRCHKLVKDSLQRILEKILQLYKTPESLRAAGIDQYDGCYNFRDVRGATHLSMHAYGAAVDFDSAHNSLGAAHGTMPQEVVSIFKNEGWRWGGDYVGRKDWMHFEACT